MRLISSVIVIRTTRTLFSTFFYRPQLCNRSDVLPIEFCCQKLAHYKCSPSAGKIPPGKVVKMSVTFLPKQLGPLNFKLQVDVMGPVKDASSSSSRKAVVYTAVVELKGSGAVGERRRERKREEVAHPSDLATSIRPYDGKTVIVYVEVYMCVVVYLCSDIMIESPTKPALIL